MTVVADTGLPVEAVVGDLRQALAEERHAVLEAEPGAGKTTVVPLRLLGERWLGDDTIVVLEPRRLAARAAARRMAALLGESVGRTVGYRTRDDTAVSDRTRIEVVTEGILTRRLQNDPALPGVGLVMFDEFHERSLVADLGLALTLDARAALRPDLRILVASATLDGAAVAALLGGEGEPAPRIAAAGRTFPVAVEWRPGEESRRPEDAVVSGVRWALDRHRGDVLAFLPGAASIQRSARALRGDGATSVHALYGSLPNAEQDAALRPSPDGRRKVVLATDIAETSLTVDGVRIVVDSGVARAPRYDPATGMTRLLTHRISQASADQRAGRSGRTADGLAVRLWSRSDHAQRPRFSSPEIERVDLAGFLLELALWGENDPGALRFLDQPSPAALAEGRELLVQLSALDEAGRVTPAGRAMARLPLHPRLARVVVAADRDGEAWLGCVIAALLEERDLFGGRGHERPADLAARVDALIGDRSHPLASTARVKLARKRAAELARRIGTRRSEATGDAGRLLMVGYPDRLAQRRPGPPGRYRLRGGGGAHLSSHDPLAAAPYLVVADADGDRRDARVRIAAAVSMEDVEARFGAEIEEATSVAWMADRDDVRARTERRLGALALSRVDARAAPGPEVTALLVDYVREAGCGVLGWTAASEALRDRLGLVRAHLGDPWPDVSDQALLDDLDDWLAPRLMAASGRRDLEAIDMTEVLWSRVGPHRRPELDRLAPAAVDLPSGRSVRLDYTEDPPVLATRVQDLFGSARTPTVLAGRLPVVLHLLSPAGRPVQITSDLAGFWSGSWHEVRKEMAGRYPKHDWPERPN